MDTRASAPKPQRVIPIAVAPAHDATAAAAMQRRRSAFQIGFFVLFILAPVFDLFRFDLDADHAWLLGFEWRLGLDDAPRRGAGRRRYGGCVAGSERAWRRRVE